MSKIVSVLDVAQYILDALGSMPTWKLQKLCYYSQAWSVVWDEEPLFKERIEAWANGPVIPALYEKHRGHFRVSRVGGDPDKLSKTKKETVDAVIEHYGDKPSVWLSELTHREAPWRNVRKKAGLDLGERGHAQITLEALADYYGGLYAESEKS